MSQVNPCAVGGTAVVRFSPVYETDSIVEKGVSQTVFTRHHCITVMNEYSNKSIEELRLEDYFENRKPTTRGFFWETRQRPPHETKFGAGPPSLGADHFGSIDKTSLFKNHSGCTSFCGSVDTVRSPSSKASGFSFAMPKQTEVSTPITSASDRVGAHVSGCDSSKNTNVLFQFVNPAEAIPSSSKPPFFFGQSPSKMKPGESSAQKTSPATSIQTGGLFGSTFINPFLSGKTRSLFGETDGQTTPSDKNTTPVLKKLETFIPFPGGEFSDSKICANTIDDAKTKTFFSFGSSNNKHSSENKDKSLGSQLPILGTTSTINPMFSFSPTNYTIPCSSTQAATEQLRFENKSFEFSSLPTAEVASTHKGPNTGTELKVSSKRKNDSTEQGETLATDPSTERVRKMPKITGVPSPIRINVGGTLYMTNLETLTKYPESILAKLFDGTIPIAFVATENSYFLDRDGSVFGHILNFLRNNKVILPETSTEIDLLKQESAYFELTALSCVLAEQSLSSTPIHQEETSQVLGANSDVGNSGNSRTLNEETVTSRTMSPPSSTPRPFTLSKPTNIFGSNISKPKASSKPEKDCKSNKLKKNS